MLCELQQGRCEPCEGIGDALTPAQATDLMMKLNSQWQVNADATHIRRDISFNHFHDTMAFINALAWIAHQENHHPDLAVGYNYCHVTFTTHALNGLSTNDFICAAKIDALLDQPLQAK